MSRKILSLLVVVAFVLTTMSTAFAATVPTDVAGTDFLKSVSKLQSLNIMGGYPDGTFKPDQTITRREFAKIAVLALNLNDAATISKGMTKFSDVAADDWASGFINVAAAQGIINGYPNGTYAPDAAIKYSEAITILCKALGYGPVLAGKKWPEAYITKAADIGMTDGVVMAPEVGASRGNVAKLTANTLDKNIVVIKSYDADGKPTYSDIEPASSLIQKKLSLTPQANGPSNTTKDWMVTSTPMVQNSSTVDESVFSGLGSFKFVDALNPNDYLGLNVKVWLDGDSKVKLTEIANSASDIYEGVIEADGSSKIKLVGRATSYEEKSGGFTGYLNSTGADFATINTAVSSNVKAMARVVIDSGRIKFINAIVADSQTGSANAYYSSTFVVKDIKDGYLRAVKGNFTDTKVQDIKDNATKKTNRYDIIKNGAVATIDDVVAGDLVTIVSPNSTSKYQRWVVTSGDVTGKLTSVSDVSPTYTLTIGGKDYKFGHDVTSTWNAGTDNTWSNGGLTLAGNLKDAIGKDVTIKLNNAGQIGYLSTTASSTTYYYGIFVNGAANVATTAGDINNAIVVYKKDGTKATYMMEKSAQLSAIHPADYTPATFAPADALSSSAGLLKAGDLIQYQLTSDNKIKDGTLKKYNTAGISDLTTDYQPIAPNDNSGNRINTALVSSDTVIFDVYNVIYNGDPVKLLTFGTIKNKAHGYSILKDGGVAKYVAVNGGDNVYDPTGASYPYNYLANDLAAGTNGVITGFGTNADGDYVTVNANGTNVTYGLTGTATMGTVVRDWNNNTSAATKGYYIDYSVDSAGKISSINWGYATSNSSAPYGVQRSFSRVRSATFRVVSIDTANSIIKVNDLDANNMNAGQTYYFAYKASDLNVYNCFDKDNGVGGKSISDISADDYIWLNVGVGDISNTQVTRIVKVKRDDIIN